MPQSIKHFRPRQLIPDPIAPLGRRTKGWSMRSPSIIGSWILSEPDPILSGEPRPRGALRITFLTNRDLASNFALNLLVPALSENHELQVFCSDAVGRKPVEPTLAELNFYEHTLPNELLFPLIDAQGSKGELLTFKGLSDYLSSPVTSLNEPNETRGLATLAASEPDLAVSIRYGCILDVPAISLPLKGVLNLHSGRLPAYRVSWLPFAPCWPMTRNSARRCTGSTMPGSIQAEPLAFRQPHVIRHSAIWPTPSGYIPQAVRLFCVRSRQ